MYNYIEGIVKDNTASFIVVDVNGIGYEINTPNPFAFEIGTKYKVYVYQKVAEDEISLYGFKTLEEKEMFLKLISVKGLGPKMTLPMLATGSVSGIIDAIDRENILYLKKFPKIGDKVARQIILDLKGKLVKPEGSVATGLNELTDVLLSLGYKQADIKRVLPQINPDLEVEEQVKSALRLMLK